MIKVVIYSLLSVLLVSLISLVGVFTLGIKEKNLKKTLLFLVSLAAGGLLGDVFIHLLPEVAENNFNLLNSLMILLGILIFFILEKFICWRHCHMLTSKFHPHPLGTMNLIGDGLHNFIDGAIIAASFLVSMPLGLATTLAVIFHEIPQEIGDFGVLIHAGFSRFQALMANFLSATMAIFGAGLVLLIGSNFGYLIESLVPFTAGGFIYIASADLIPELQKETNLKKSLMQLLGIVIGITIMLVLTLIE